MALSWKGACGFGLRSPALFDALTPSTSDGFVGSVTAGPWSRYAYNPNVGEAGISTRDATVHSTATGTGFWMACSWYPSGSASPLVWLFDPSGIRHLRLERNNASGKIDLLRDSTFLASSDRAVALNVWHSVELFVLVDDTGGRVKLLIDGVTEIDFTGDTRNAGTAAIGQIRLPDNGTDYLVDDLVWGIGTVSDAPGFVRVWELLPNADGDLTQLAKSPTSATRWYLPSNDNVFVGPDPNAAAISPTPDAAWEHTTRVLRRQLHPARGRSRMHDGSGIFGGFSARDDLSYSGISSGDDLLWYQFISPPLAAQTISGTVKGQLRVAEGSTSDDERAQVVIRVVSGDGTTVRGTLLGPDTGALSSEFGTSATNRRFPRGGAQTMTSVAAQAGDRIVVEIGCRHHGTTTSSNPLAVVGDAAASDLPEDETTTSNSNGWIEFSNAIQLHSTLGNWELAAEGPSDDGSVLRDSVVDEADLYGFGDLAGSDLILGVSHYARARRDQGGPGKLQLGVRRAANTSWSAELPLPAGFGVVVRDMDQDPANSVAWTAARVNEAQFGARVR
jgi:hypothetical protein